MARMVPDLGEGQLQLVKSRAERRFYEACKSELPQDWTVLFSTPWVGTTPTGRRYDGEADFIVLAPSLGVLVVEVKGGGVSYDPASGEWSSVDQAGVRHAIKDPFRQATAEKHQLIQILRSDHRWNRDHPGRLLAGHAVFLADVERPKHAVSPEGPAEILGGRGDLARLKVWIESTLKFWAGNDASWLPLSPRAIATAESILHGPIEARPLVKTYLEAEEQVRFELTQQQCRVLRGMATRRRAAICGGAGTGKTVLAMEKARQLAVDGAETLLLCYNRLLGDYLKASCYGVERLSPMTYHQLCSWRVREAQGLSGRDLLAEARREPSAKGPDAEYDFVLPHALALSCDATPLRYDAIVIDEGQDFKEEYWLGIEWLLRDASSHLYVFYDQNQALYTRARSMPIDDPPFVLTMNCRNTRHIHEAVYRYFRGDPTEAPPGNEGVPVAVLGAPSTGAQGERIHAAVTAFIDREGVRAEQIAVLVCGEPKEEYYSALERRPLPGGARWAREGAAADAGVRLETVRRFKGLEADIVYLWGVDNLSPRDQREMLYVGLSRAKSRLTLVGSESACLALREGL